MWHEGDVRTFRGEADVPLEATMTMTPYTHLVTLPSELARKREAHAPLRRINRPRKRGSSER